MGQQEVFAFLRRNKNKWFTTRQIAERLKVSLGSVTMSLKILRQSKQIKYKKIITNSYNLGKRKVFTYQFMR